MRGAHPHNGDLSQGCEFSALLFDLLSQTICYPVYHPCSRKDSERIYPPQRDQELHDWNEPCFHRSLIYHFM